MATVTDELTSLKEFLAGTLGDGCNFCIQYTPKKYEANTVIINLLSSSRNSETGYHTKSQRSYQITYFCNSMKNCVATADELEGAFTSTQIVPIVDADNRYIRIDSVASSRAFETETLGIYAVVLVVGAHVRNMKPQHKYEKINDVSIQGKPSE